MKATAQELSFHQRMLNRDKPGHLNVFAELAEWIYTDLVNQTRIRAGASEDPMLIEEAVGIALLDYDDNPEDYDPSRSSLHSYLVMKAFYRFKDARRKELRIVAKQKPLNDESITERDLETVSDDIEQLLSRLRSDDLWSHIEGAFPDPIDRQMLLLVVNGVHLSAPYARVLGIEHLPEVEQRQEVNRVKHRIRTKLRRIGDKIDE